MAVVLLTVLATGGPSSRDADVVTSLPGLDGPLSSKHYSGFLNVPSSSASQSAQAASSITKVHYWMMLSESDPAHDPVLLWYNGGPPCSSLVGAFTELGPYRTTAASGDAAGALALNPDRWNSNATLLFIESPAGVGFSYNSVEGGYDTDDTATAQLNLGALLAFYGAFPEYAANELFLAGESYAGIYVPMLAQQVVRHNRRQEEKEQAGVKVRLVGMMVGNGAIATGDWYEGWLTGLRTKQAFQHGLFSPRLFGEITKACTNYTKGIISPGCQDLLAQVKNQTGNLNEYDLRQTCLGTGSATHDHTHADSNARVPADAQQPLTMGTGPGEDPCDLGATDLIRYMSRADVQKAIHVEASARGRSTGNWADCGGSFGRPVRYTRVPQDERVDVYPDLIGAIRILIFNGDQDNCIPYEQDETWTAEMGLAELRPWAPWIVNDQVGGYQVRYEKDFTFTTVKGAGHMCPSTQPERAHHMMMRFIRGVPL